MGFAGGLMSTVGDDVVAVYEVRGEHAVVSGEMGAGARHRASSLRERHFRGGDEIGEGPADVRHRPAWRPDPASLIAAARHCAVSGDEARAARSARVAGSSTHQGGPVTRTP